MTYNYAGATDNSFDFMTVWRISQTTGYPILQWQDPLTSAYTVSGLFAGGSGTSVDPWLISNEAQLRNIANAYYLDNTILSQNFKLTADISITGNFFPLSSNSHPFGAIFDGNNKTIQSLNITRMQADYIGLFGQINASGVLKDLTITTTGINASGRNFVGVAVGSNAGKISNVHVKGASGAGTETITGASNIGGLAGHHSGANTTTLIITQCSAEKLTLSFTGNQVGGLIGVASSSGSGLVKQSFADVTLTTGANSASYIGGFIGNLYQTTAQDNYSTSTITITGGTGHSNIGGFIGYATYDTIVNSYAMGNTCSGSCSNSTNAGPFIGYHDPGSGSTIKNSFWNSGTTGGWSSSSFNEIKLSDAESKVTYNYAGATDNSFDFMTIWRLSQTTGYPILQWQDPLSTPYTLSSFFAGGSGTSVDPWLISNETQLRNILNAYYLDNTILSQNFKLTADISLSGNFQPLSSNSHAFSGTFDGNNKMIQNLSISKVQYDYVGLFGQTTSSSVIKDLTITTTGISAAGRNFVGVAVGSNYGKLSNVHVKGASGAGTEIITGASNLGGLAGIHSGANNTTLIVTQCSAEKLTLSFTGNQVGGLIGVVSSGGSTLVKLSFADVTLTTGANSASYIGGLIGNIYQATAQDSYSTSTITITGGTGHSNIGGFAGYATYDSIINAYAMGNVCSGSCSNSTNAGPFIGYHDPGSGSTIKNSFWNSGTAGGWSSSSFNEVKLSDAEFKITSNFAGAIDNAFDFMTVWRLSQTTSYPILQWQDPLVTPYTVSGFFAGGSGTSIDPWLISNETQLRGIANAYYLDNTIVSQNFKLTANIALSGHFFPLSSSTHQFTGTFDGNSKTIQNLSILRVQYDYNGLFGYIGAAGVVKDLTITTTGVNGAGRNYTGVLSGVSEGKISNVHIKGASGAGTEIISGMHYVGGLVGVYQNGNNSTKIITQCSAELLTLNTTGNSIGGLVGSASSSSSGLVKLSFANVAITTSNSGTNSIGGFVGYLYGSAVQDSYSMSSVAISGGATHDYMGGFAGYVYGGTILNAYSTGNVCSGSCTGTTYSDPFAGRVDLGSGSTITRGYFNTSTSGWSSSATATAGLTDTQMTTDSNANSIVDGLDAAGWSTANWVLDPPHLTMYPKLIWEP